MGIQTKIPYNRQTKEKSKENKKERDIKEKQYKRKLQKENKKRKEKRLNLFNHPANIEKLKKKHA